MLALILKRGDPSRRRDNDYDVLEDGKIVGRIFHLEAAAPEGRPWMWASGHGGHIERAAHGYEPTREAAMAAFAKSWRCPKVGQTTQVDKNRLGPGTDF